MSIGEAVGVGVASGSGTGDGLGLGDWITMTGGAADGFAMRPAAAPMTPTGGVSWSRSP